MTVIVNSFSRIEAKTFAEDFRRYASRISPSVRIRRAHSYIERLLASKTIKDTDIVRSTPSAPSTCVQKGNEAVAEPEIDFIPQTDTQKRTRRVVQPYRPNSATGYNVLPGEILAYLRKHERATNREIAQGLGRAYMSVKDATKRMAERGELQEIRFGKQGLMYKMKG